MSGTIDNRVVEMEFDNKEFESNVKTSMSTIEKLKKSLNFDGVSKGLNNLNSAIKKTDFSGTSNGIETINAKFSAMQVIGMTALSNITNSAINAGKRIKSALIIDPIKTGFEEYETQMGAIQTILANTQKEGTTVETVNKALDELNLYADKTIYNFTEMTRNIGKFTAAGVKLDTSVNAIKGIANLAAVSGSTSQQASTAMYQLSQALAAGKVQLMDWNSVVNAGMGGQVFQEALIRTSENLKTGAKEAINTAGSFRESLTKSGWLTAEVLTETLNQISGAYSKADLIEQGYTEKQADEIMKLAKTAVNAATEVKTVTQLWNTLKEAAQSGWGQSWRIIVGDFEEAKQTLTVVSKVIGGIIDASSNARNEVLQGWKDLGGRTELLNSFKNIFSGITSVVKPSKEAFRDIFPAMTSERLYSITKSFSEFTEKLKLTETQSENLKETFKGVFSIIDIGRKAITSVLKPVFSFLTGDSIASAGDGILFVTASIGKLFTKLNEGIKIGDGFTFITSTLNVATDIISIISHKIGDIGKGFSSTGTTITNVFSNIINSIGKIINWTKDTFSIGDIFAGLAGGGIFVAAKKFTNLIDMIKESLEGFSLFGKDESTSHFSEILNGVHDSLESFSEGIKVASLVGIGVAVSLLSSSLKKISEIKPENVAYSLLTIRMMISSLNSGFNSLCKTLSTFNAKGSIKASMSMIVIAEAVNILASAMVKMKDLSLVDVAKGLIGINGSIYALSAALNRLGQNGLTLRTSIAILTLSNACKTLSQSLAKFGSMSLNEIVRGLTAMGGALGEFTGIIAILNKVSGTKAIAGSAAVLIISKSLGEISENLKSMGQLSWNEIVRGLTAMGGALTELSIVSGVLGKISGLSGIIGAGTIVTAVTSLDAISESLERLGFLSWSEIQHGLAAMCGALTELAVVSGTLGKLTGLSGIFGAETLVIAVNSLDDISKVLENIGLLSWDEIARGLVGMGGALTEIAVISGALGVFAGISGIIGAGVINATIQGLDKLASALQKFGFMSWDEIARGLVAMGGALTELSVISGALGYLGGIAGLVGAGTITLATQGLEQLANALQKFGSMSWSEIGHGLVAMGAALGEIAIGGVINTLSFLGSMSIENVSASLGALADALKKFGEIEWETLSNGLKAMGSAMGKIALGGLLNTFSILGSMSISTVAEPLGALADSVKKWVGVTIPENLSSQMLSLAKAILAFTLGGLGAGALATCAPAVGQMADSIKKWKDVSIPENLGTGLESIAKGVKSFATAFVGGISISMISGSIGKLADGIKKMSTITVPDTLDSNLKKVSDAIKNFSLIDTAKISTIAGPIKTFGSALKNFGNIKSGGDGAVTAAKNIRKCADELKGISSVSITNASVSIKKLADTLKKANSTNVSNVASFVKAANSLNKINISGVKVDTSGLNSAVSAVKSSMNSMKSSVSGSKSSITNAMKTAVSGMPSAVKSTNSSVTSSVKSLMSGMVRTISGYKNRITAAFRSSTSGAASGVRANYSAFSSAGSYLGSGLVIGIASKRSAAYNAGYALGRAAVAGEKAGQASHSPSKLTIQAGKWLGEGLVIGINSMVSAVNTAGYKLGDSSVSSISDSISRISDIFSGDMNAEPTISPVVDLTNVENGANAIGNMLTMNPPIDTIKAVNSINTRMSRNRQNGTNDDIISAIDRLRKDLNNTNGTTYNINGVTYDDGSNVSNAVATLVRAVRLEGRM